MSFSVSMVSGAEETSPVLPEVDKSGGLSRGRGQRFSSFMCFQLGISITLAMS